MRNLLGIFWSPSVVFARLLERPRAALVVFVIMGALWAAHWTVHQRVDLQAMQRQVAADLGADGKGSGVSDKEVTEQAQRELNMKRILGYPALGLGLPLLLMLFSIFFYLFLATWRKGVSFKQVYRLMAHAWLPLAVRQLSAIPVILTYPSIHPERTQALFKTDMASLLGTPNAVLGLLEPFALWCGGLIYLAARVSGRGRIASGLVALVLALGLAVVFKGL